MNQNQKYYYVRRASDGKMLDIPERDLQATLSRGFTLVGEVKLFDNKFNPPKAEEDPTAKEFQCPLCPFKAKSAFGLNSHKRTHQ